MAGMKASKCSALMCSRSRAPGFCCWSASNPGRFIERNRSTSRTVNASGRSKSPFWRSHTKPSIS